MLTTNKAVAQHIVEEIFVNGNITGIEALVAQDVIIHDTDKELHGIEQLKQGIINLRIAFPDLHYTILDLLADDDKVIARCKGSGTHKGLFRGIPATNKKMTYTVIFIWRFTEGKLAEHWSVSDVYGMLQQLDVIRLKDLDA